MSESVKNVKRSLVVPYVGIDRLIDQFKILHKRSSREIKLTELATLMNCGISNLSNVMPTLAVFDLGSVKKGVLSLTTDGLVFADACASDDLTKAKQIIKKNVQNSEVLEFVKSLLETRTSVSGDEIGRALSERFDKNWKDIRTTRIFGNSCASLLAFAGHGYYYDGILSSKPPTVKTASSVSAPESNYNEILKVLNATHGFEKARIREISSKAKQKEAAVYQALTVTTILQLTEKEPNNVYRLTDDGQQLIDPLMTEEEKQKVFRKCLLRSKYGEIIQRLAKSRTEVSFDEIGEVLRFHLQRNWSKSTKEVYGKKFGHWLTHAGIIEKVGPSKYTIKKDLLQDVEAIQETKHVDAVGSENVFEIGRAIGSLESIILDVDKSKFFNEKLAFLKGLLEEYEDLKLTLDMLGNNFEVATITKNLTVYRSSVDFVRNKVKEKILGGNKV